MAGMLEQIKNGYPVARVRAYVDSLFANGVESIKSEDILVNSDTDFILLVLAIVRANDKGMTYLVQMGKGRIERNGYRIPNMIIRKEEGKSHVE
jgi:hypothetical protein